MPQTVLAESTAKVSASAQKFLAALKSGFNQNLDGDLFANLLSQTKGQGPELRLPPRSVEADERPSRAAISDRSQRADTTDRTDLNQVRDALRDVREKLAALREQAKSAKDSSSDTSSPDDSQSDTSAVAPTDDQPVASAASNEPAVTDQTAATDSNQSTSGADQDSLTAEQLAALPVAAQISQLQTLEHRLSHLLTQLENSQHQADSKTKLAGLAQQGQQTLQINSDAASPIQQIAPDETKNSIKQDKSTQTAAALQSSTDGGNQIITSKENGQNSALQTYLEQKQTKDAKLASYKENETVTQPEEAKQSASITPTAAVAVAATAGNHSGKDSTATDAGARQQAGVAAVNGSGPVVVEGLKGANSSYDFAGQLSASRLTKGGTVGLPNIVEQVAVQINKQAKDGLDHMTIQLRPAELGRVEIRLDFGTDQRVSGRVIVDNPATLDLLQKDARGIERALQDAGLRADAGSLEFSLRDGNQSGQAWQQDQRQQRQQGGSRLFVVDQSANLNDVHLQAESFFAAPGRVNLKV